MLLETVIPIVASVLASSGLWAYVLNKRNKKDARSQMLLGLGHDRIVYLGLHYIERGWITQEEYENLHDYLYLPYAALGGNGTAKRVIEEVQKLPIKKGAL